MGIILERVNSREEKQTIKKAAFFLIIRKGRQNQIKGVCWG